MQCHCSDTYVFSKIHHKPRSKTAFMVVLEFGARPTINLDRKPHLWWFWNSVGLRCPTCSKQIPTMSTIFQTVSNLFIFFYQLKTTENNQNIFKTQSNNFQHLFIFVSFFKNGFKHFPTCRFSVKLLQGTFFQTNLVQTKQIRPGT